MSELPKNVKTSENDDRAAKNYIKWLNASIETLRIVKTIEMISKLSTTVPTFRKWLSKL